MTNSTLSAEYVTDTMALVLHLEGRRFSPRVKEIFEAADRGDIIVNIPGIVFAELFYLSEKGRITADLSDVKTLLSNESGYKQIPLSLEIVENAKKLSDIPELHDRLIAATANFVNLDLITNDPKIQHSGFVDTIG